MHAIPEAVACDRGSGDGFDRPWRGCRPIIKYHRNHRKPQTGVSIHVSQIDGRSASGSSPFTYYDIQSLELDFVGLAIRFRVWFESRLHSLPQLKNDSEQEPNTIICGKISPVQRQSAAFHDIGRRSHRAAIPGLP